MNALNKFDAAFIAGDFINHHEDMLNATTNVLHLNRINSSTRTVHSLKNLFEMAEGCMCSSMCAFQRLNCYCRDNGVGKRFIYSCVESTTQTIKDTANAFTFINEQ